MRRLLWFAALAASLLPAAEFPVARYGAKGDGTSLNTAAIQRALDAASAARGTVVFSPGVYLTGALFVKSGTHLRIDEGVVLRGVQDIAAYPEMPSRIAGIEMTWPSALLNVYRQHNVRISGKGKVDGDGKIWWDLYWKMRKEQYEPKGLRWAVDYDCRRPRLIQVFDCDRVDLEDLTLERSGFWTVHVCYSRNIKVSGVVIRNNIGGHGPSTDGIDIDSSSHVRVERCDIECNDDAICLKAGRDADGLRVNRATEYVEVRDCTVRGGAAGITIGSETSGGIHHVDASGIKVLAGVPNGILFKSASTRGGLIEHISLHDITMEGVGAAIAVALNWNPSYSYAKLPEDGSNIPAHWRTLAEPVAPEKGLPRFRDVRIAGIRATGARTAFAVSSYPEAPLRTFEFSDLDIEAKSAGSIQHAENWTFTNTRIRTADGSKVAVKDSQDVRGLDPPAAIPRKFNFDAREQTRPFFFSTDADEGNWRVAITLGSADRSATTTVKAELRRLMLENVRTRRGEFVTRSFVVNVRNAKIAGGGEVRLKEREKTMEAAAWDGKLTLEFNGAPPAVASVEITPAPEVPTIFIAGDSTSTDQPREPYNSWGQMITRFFTPDVAVANHGESGESLHSFIAERRLEKLLSVIRPGDWLLIQMGHNDQKLTGDGVGAFSSYKEELKRFITGARGHGATPVLITPMHRRTFDPAGHISNSLGDFPEAVRQTAQEERVALIDLHAMSAQFYEALGPEGSPRAFAPGDGTHHNNYGSYELARAVVEAIRCSGLPLARYLTSDTSPFDPTHPDPIEAFNIPASPAETVQKPYGN